jgi:hypothetical protein
VKRQGMLLIEVGACFALEDGTSERVKQDLTGTCAIFFTGFQVLKKNPFFRILYQKY